MRTFTGDALGSGCCDSRAIVRSTRVLNYDLARWATELRPQLRGKDHALLLDIDERPLPPVLCDRTQLRQVVANLVTSAHTVADPGGCITLSARAAGRFIRIAVEGTGSHTAVRPRACEPFARTIIEAHGGSIVVEAGAGGNRFAFTLPIHRGSTGTAGRPAA